MNSKTVFIGLGVLIVVVLSIVIVQNKSYKPAPAVKINSLSTSQAPESATSQTTQEYSDPAGFKFNYPDTVTVSPKDTTDENAYSSLVVASSKNQGKMTIDAVSSSLTALDSLVKSKSAVTDVKLADLDAKQFTEKGSIVTLALDKGVLFTLTVSSGGNVNFWNDVNNKVISSFAFAAPEKAQVKSDTSTPADTGSAGDSAVSFEGEETIE
ncbi:hypothetical protein HZC27_03855 [Candidatus Roizmanbacteria bacterium]|nr:hypothetical protein [Candidatus Roizmanbacteria bacterium]